MNKCYFCGILIELFIMFSKHLFLNLLTFTSFLLFSGLQFIMFVKGRNPMLTLLFFSILMITLPITAFFMSQYIVENYFHVSMSNSYIYSTACSVVVIHIILAFFIYYAYKEDKVVPLSEKED